MQGELIKPRPLVDEEMDLVRAHVIFDRLGDARLFPSHLHLYAVLHYFTQNGAPNSLENQALEDFIVSRNEIRAARLVVEGFPSYANGVIAIYRQSAEGLRQVDKTGEPDFVKTLKTPPSYGDMLTRYDSEGRLPAGPKSLPIRLRR